jgi:hypothetical protein
VGVAVVQPLQRLMVEVRFRSAARHRTPSLI